MVSLSQTYDLSPAQLQLLDKGLSFIPLHLVFAFGTLLADLGRFHMKVQRASYFGPSSYSSRALPFCEKSNWMPPAQCLPGEIWDFLKKIALDIGRKLITRRDRGFKYSLP